MDGDSLFDGVFFVSLDRADPKFDPKRDRTIARMVGQELVPPMSSKECETNEQLFFYLRSVH